MGYRHDPDELLRAAADLALKQGLGALTFKRVGDRLGISDRTVVYYFADKATLIGAVLDVLGLELQCVLATAFGEEPLPADELARRAWPTLASPASDPIMRTVFDAIGRACAGEQPYDERVPALIEAWVAWLEPRLDHPAKERRAQALGLVARIDGLLMMRQLLGAGAAHAAAGATGLTPLPR